MNKLINIINSLYSHQNQISNIILAKLITYNIHTLNLS